MTSRDPSYFLLTILEYSGLAKQPGKKNTFYLLIRWYTYIQFVVTVVSLWKYALEDHPFFDKGLSLEACISTVHLGSKLVNIKVRQAKFWELMRDLSSIWEECNTYKIYYDILEKRRVLLLKVMKVILMIYTIPNFLTISLSLLGNLLMDLDERDLPYKVWDPIRDTLGEDYFWLRFTYEAVFIGGTVFLYGIASSILVSCSHMACAQMEVLIRMLEVDRIDVKTCVHIHQKNVKLVKDINSFFSGLLMLEMILAAAVTSFRLYVIVLMWKAGNPKVFGELVYLIIVMGDPFLICYNGQIITELSDKVYLSSYQSKWYNLSIKDQKALQLLMCKAHGSLKLQYRRLMTFDMISYGAMVQATYSYITILLQA